jgi:hypothetical protein
MVPPIYTPLYANPYAMPMMLHIDGPSMFGSTKLL